MLEGEIDDVARTIRKLLQRGESCECLYHAAVPPLRLAFVPITDIVYVGGETSRTAVVASAFPAEVRAVEDATLVAWLGVGSAVMPLAGDRAPMLQDLRLGFPAASISGLRALGDLLHRVCHDPFAAAKAAEARELGEAS